MSVKQDNITATMMHTAPTPSVPSLVLVSLDILGMVLSVQVANHTELKLTVLCYSIPQRLEPVRKLETGFIFSQWYVSNR